MEISPKPTPDPGVLEVEAAVLAVLAVEISWGEEEDGQLVRLF